jgi:hypothetical protein
VKGLGSVSFSVRQGGKILKFIYGCRSFGRGLDPSEVVRESLAGFLASANRVVQLGGVSINSAEKRRGKPWGAGNPPPKAGRPKGARNKTTLACLDLLDGEGLALTRVAVDRAKAGDPVALRLVVDRIMPRGRGRGIEIEVPHVARPEDLVAACACVIDAAAAGELTLTEAESFMRILDQQRKAIESQDLSMRVELLEAELRGFRR